MRRIEQEKIVPDERMLQNAFQGRFEPVRASFLYKLGLFIVALAMICLPLLYLAMIAGIGWGIYYHATENIWIITASSSFSQFKLTLYLGPIVIGGILIFFMIKPLFTSQAGEPNTIDLDPEQEGLVFELVKQICKTVKAPVPDRIQVDCEVNASASFSNKFTALFTNSLVLTVGMPLVRSLDLAQFVGVLSHEFGHFTQGAGMRLSYIIRRINYWFHRVVYEKDSLNRSISKKTPEIGILIPLVMHAARFFVWLASKFLSLFMHLGYVISSFMMRQMEYDADQYEIRMVGSETFVSKEKKMMLMSAAVDSAYSGMSASYTDGRLPDNIPEYINFHTHRIQQEPLDWLEASLNEEETGLFDTHPSNKDRIQKALEKNTPGIFALEARASDIFLNFEELSRQVTRQEYEENLGSDFTEELLESAQEAIIRDAEADDSADAGWRAFQDNISTIRPLWPRTSKDGARALADIIDELKRLRVSLLREARQNAGAMKLHSKSDARMMMIISGRALLNAGFNIEANEFKMKEGTLQGAKIAFKRAREKREAANKALAAFDEIAMRRLACAGSLLRDASIVAKAPEAVQLHAEYNRLCALLGKFQKSYQAFNDLRVNYIALTALREARKDASDTDRCLDEIEKYRRKLRKAGKKLRAELLPLDYPFKRGSEPLSLADFVMEVLPPLEKTGKAADIAERALGQYVDFYLRVMARLAAIAEKAEDIVGLEKLPAPEDS